MDVITKHRNKTNEHLLYDKQKQNERRWEHFLSDLTSKRCKRQRYENLDSLVGPASISKKLALQINSEFAVDIGSLKDESSFDKTTSEKSDLKTESESAARKPVKRSASEQICDDIPSTWTFSEEQQTTVESRPTIKTDYKSTGDIRTLSDELPFHSTFDKTTYEKSDLKAESESAARKPVKSSASEQVCEDIPSSWKRLEEEQTTVESRPTIKTDYKRLGDVPALSQEQLLRSTAILKAVQPKQKIQWPPIVKKGHLSMSSSQWDLKMFSKYIDFEKDVYLENIATDDVNLSDLQNNFIKEHLQMFQTSKSPPSLDDVLKKEADIRMLLTSMLQKLCAGLKFGFRTEEHINFKYLPTCQFDFLFRNYDGKPIGCLEAKTSSTMNSKAFVQAVLQLLVLQQLACKHNVDVTTVPLFNILTDGQRFVLLRVKGEKLWLEEKNEEEKYEEKKLKIRTDSVMESMYKLIEVTLNSMQ